MITYSMPFLLMRTVKITLKIYKSQVITWSITFWRQSKSKTSYRKIFQKSACARKILSVTVILEHTIVKEAKKWELSGENNKDVTNHFSGATTDNMKSYIRSPHYQIIQSLLSCGTNDWRQNTSAVEIVQKILEFNFKFQSGSNNILISGFVPLPDKSNAKVA